MEQRVERRDLECVDAGANEMTVSSPAEQEA